MEHMEYEVFLNGVREAVEALCPECQRAVITRIMKNNSLELDGLVIQEEGVSASPAIYLDGYYEKYLEGMEIDGIARNIVGIHRECAVSFDAEKYYEPDFVRERILCRLINTGRNGRLLEAVPHRDFLDLSVVYYCRMEDIEVDGMATMLIRNSHMERLGLTEEELYGLAVSNMAELMPTEIRSLSEVLDELAFGRAEVGQPPEGDDDVKMYVASNVQGLFGAACMLDGSALEAFAERNGAFYIIPSSVHELLLVPVSEGVSGKRLCDIVLEVNDTQVSHEEFLSDSVYIYDTIHCSVLKINNINQYTLKN